MKCVECGFMECYILIILYHLLHICFLYKIMLKVFFAFFSYVVYILRWCSFFVVIYSFY